MFCSLLNLKSQNVLKYNLHEGFGNWESNILKLRFLMSQGLSPADYNKKKELIADEIIGRLEKKLFPGLKSSILFKEVLFQKI